MPGCADPAFPVAGSPPATSMTSIAWDTSCRDVRREGSPRPPVVTCVFLLPFGRFLGGVSHRNTFCTRVTATPSRPSAATRMK